MTQVPLFPDPFPHMPNATCPLCQELAQLRDVRELARQVVRDVHGPQGVKGSSFLSALMQLAAAVGEKTR